MNELEAAIAAAVAGLSIPAGVLSATAVPVEFPDFVVELRWERWSSNRAHLVLTVTGPPATDEIPDNPLASLYRRRVTVLRDGTPIVSTMFHAGVQPTFVLVPGQRLTASTSFRLVMIGHGWVGAKPSIGPEIFMNPRYTVRIEAS